MKKFWVVLTTGFALFAMFFGSGNLVFPLTVGKDSQGHVLLASLGILMTGVVVPFLGVFGMLLFRGHIDDFFKVFGKKGTFLFVFFALSIMGPFGVFARCLTVAHGSVDFLIPGASLPLTSLILCACIYFLTVNKSRMVSLLGSTLTPILIGAVGLIGYFGLQQNESLPAVANVGFESFKNGFLQGYQTMDLLAAFFFSSFIIAYLRKKDEKNSLKLFFPAAFIGASLLAAVYIVLVLLGNLYAPLLDGKEPQEMLGIISMQALGSYAAPVVCVTVVLACITTAIVLASLFADFFRTQVCKEKIGNKRSLLITIGIGFLISTLEFAGIAKILGPILEIIYPALITLTLTNIIGKIFGLKSNHWPVTATLFIRLLTI